MIKLLVDLPLIGRFTIIIVWHREGNGRAGSGVVSPGPATSILQLHVV
jgi:hypothetical protein